MPYFAAAFARTASGWAGEELDLDGAEDIGEVAERMREVDESSDLMLLFVEEDDEYLAVVRLDDGEDPRVFVSDTRAGTTSRLGEMLLAETEPPDLSIYAEDEATEEVEPVDDSEDRADPDVEPAGDPELLGDLGTSAKELLTLCAHEGTLPADVITEVCARAGCLDQLEELREG